MVKALFVSILMRIMIDLINKQHNKKGETKAFILYLVSPFNCI